MTLYPNISHLRSFGVDVNHSELMHFVGSEPKKTAGLGLINGIGKFLLN